MRDVKNKAKEKSTNCNRGYGFPEIISDLTTKPSMLLLESATRKKKALQKSDNYPPIMADYIAGELNINHDNAC